MSTSLKKYFPAGTPVKWSASADKFFPSSGELILNDDTTLNIELKHNFSYDYWVVVEADNNADSIDQVQYFEVYTKNYGMLSLVNLPEIGERFYGIRKSDYPDLQWDFIRHNYHDGTISRPTSRSSFKQIQIDFGNQEITGSRFPIQTINKGGSTSYPYAILYFDDLYMFGGGGIQSYNGISYLYVDSLKIFSKVPSDVKFSVNVSGSSGISEKRSLYVQNPTGFTTGYQMFSGLGRCSVNIEDFDFSNINDVRYMFNSMHLTGVDSYPLFDTSHITDMSYMFGNTLKATPLLNNIPLYNTSNVTNMSGMFSRRGINTTLPNWNMSNVTNVSYMFNEATINTTLPNWNMSNVTNVSYMFARTTINSALPNWDTSNVTNMRAMFHLCRDINNIRIDMNECAEATYMFDGCTSLSDLYISNLKTSIDLSDCPLTRDSALFIINNLQTVPSADGKYIDFNSSTYDTLSSADIANATRKGWTIHRVK